VAPAGHVRSDRHRPCARTCSLRWHYSARSERTSREWRRSRQQATRDRRIRVRGVTSSRRFAEYSFRRLMNAWYASRAASFLRSTTSLRYRCDLLSVLFDGASVRSVDIQPQLHISPRIASSAFCCASRSSAPFIRQSFRSYSSRSKRIPKLPDASEARTRLRTRSPTDRGTEYNWR